MKTIEMSLMNTGETLSRSEMKSLKGGRADEIAKKCGTCDYGNQNCTSFGSGSNSGCSCPTSSGGANTTCTET
jgi:hypothetical protein